MSQAYPRKNPLLNDAVEILDAHLDRFQGDLGLAWKNLAKDESAFITEELAKCASDARYYLENYHVIKTEDEGFRTLYPFWDSQEIFYQVVVDLQNAGKPVKIIVLKARQLGISTVTEGLIFHKTIFTEACNTLIVAQDPGQADYLFGMSRLAYDSLPWWMRPEARYEAKGRYLIFDREDDAERQRRPGLRSEIFVQAANKITGVAVGRTIRAGHLSELSDWPNAKILTTQIFPTMNARDEFAVLESTARGRKGFWYEFWCDVEDGRAQGWTPVFIEWFRCGTKYQTKLDPGEKFERTEAEKSVAAKIEKRTNFVLTDEHLKWRRQTMGVTTSLEGAPWMFYQEYPSSPIEAFQTSGICAFPKELLQDILETQCADPAWVGEIEYDLSRAPRERVKLKGIDIKPGDEIPSAELWGTRLRIWEMPVAGESYYVSGDVAHGVEGGDYSCAQVIKIGHGMEPDAQVAEWHGWINPTKFAYVLAGLGVMYNNAEISPESNDVGIATLNELLLQIEYPNLFRWKHYDSIKNRFTNLLGWWTNVKTRDLIIAKFREAMMEKTLIIRSEALIDECMDFSAEDADSRFEGQETNDDRVFGAMIANFCAHDSDYGKAAATAPKPEGVGPGTAVYFIFDSLGRYRGQFTKEEEVQAVLSLNPGWQAKKSPVRRDFNNTDFSPVHDRPGIQNDLYRKMNIPAEAAHEMMLHGVTPPREGGDGSWKDY